MVVRRTRRLRPACPYELAVAVRGHGWYDLAPHRWDGERRALTTAIALDADRAIDVCVSPGSDRVPIARLVAAAEPTRDELARVERGLRRMLRVDIDLTEFWNECARHDCLAWVPRVRAGYLMQSPALFEDLLKILFTTNCTWAATRGMCRNLVEALGPRAPSGRGAFPLAEVCAGRDAGFWRDVVRVGYRAPACVSLARSCADGSLSEAELDSLDTDELRRRLRGLRGFGPYAAGHAMRGFGCYADLALDSWCRARMTELLGRRRQPTDAWFERRYRRFGRYAGLALWMELTADWHRDELDRD